MLTDIFADRYSSRTLWASFGELESKLLVQCFRIVSEQVMPYYVNGNENPIQKAKWDAVHNKLSMELGLNELSPRAYSYQTTLQGKVTNVSGLWNVNSMCEKFVLAQYDGSISADRFVKERMSFIELAFREEENELKVSSLNLEQRIDFATKMEQIGGGRHVLKIPGTLSPGKAIRALHESSLKNFQQSVAELNERLRRAKTHLNYHNGFLQLSVDPLTEGQIERAFWQIVAYPLWKNVDIDMKEAIDRRDNGERDASFYAMRGLESAIKIISDTKGWTTGNEKGAHNYIDNLGSKSNGFIEGWERDVLKNIFTQIRNPLGHGPGKEEMPELTIQQTNWAIETCMSWIKSLAQRM